MRHWVFLFLFATMPLCARGLKFDSMSHNFGKLLQHKTVHWVTEVTNTSKHTIKLLQVRANCGCTVPVPEKVQLSPGESMKIKISFDSGMFQGPQEKVVTVKTDEPYTYFLLINVNVVKEYSFTPGVMEIRNFDGKAVREVDLSSNIKSKKFTIERVECRDSCIKLKKNSPTEVEITAVGDVCEGDHTVLFYLSGLKDPVYYHVVVHLLREIRVEPSHILFMGIHAGTKALRSVTLKWKMGGYKLEKMSCDVPFIRIAGSESLEDGLRINLESIPGKMKKGYGTGKLKLRMKTSAGKVENVLVPVAYNLF
ncbi:MAG: DUF1573 domain-containing protein [Acidobacteria bacterium]|nr:DUF1573 domain-containing protein [Acidobacteriota bacterium]